MLNSEFFITRKHHVWCNLVLLLAQMLLGVGCSKVNDGMVRGKDAEAVMDKVELILDDDAALADSLIKLIDSKSLRGKENRARYAILYTGAEYKNYHRATSDSLIMTAVRYYSISNNMDYRFLSNYYLGCVYLNLNRYTDAAAAFVNAEQLSGFISNKHWKGLLFIRLGEIFDMASDFNRAVEYYAKAVPCFQKAAREQYRLRALFNLGKNKMNNQEFGQADSILRIAERGAYVLGDSVLQKDCLYNRLACFVYMDEPDSATALLNKYGLIIDERSTSPGYLETMAMYFVSIKEYSKAERFLNRALSCDLSDNDSIYLYYVNSMLAQRVGETEKALEYFREYSSLQNNNLREILSQPVLGAQKEQYRILAENERLKYSHARLTLILCVVIFLLIIVIVLVTYHYKKKRMKEQLYDSLTVVDELYGKIEDLKNQVRVQFHERHDLSNRLYSMYFDSESQDKITKQQLNVTINSLIKDYTAPDSVKKLDKLLNESYDGIMDRLTDPEIGLTDKEVELFRYSFAGLSSKAVSIIIKESPQNIYQIKSRLLKKVRRYSEDLWNKLSAIW
ncbi:MAG: hypothetical protein J6W18_07725 [Bacteroidaceae bacterium]|nr:hypothetical protein [Bacteroidaceae bacterium]